MNMHTLTDLIEANFDPDPDVTAAAVFAAANVPAKWRDLFYSVVRDECRRNARNIVRMHERTSDPTTEAATSKSNTSGRGWPFLADHTYYGPAHGYVVNGHATIEQWLARADYIDGQVAGLVRTSNYCRDMAELLESSGAQCLYDYYKAVAS